jgi:hypothetical protein
VREAERLADREISIGDETFPVGASLSSRFAIQSVPFRYIYSFVMRENMEVAGTVGVHWYVNDFQVEGSASLGNLDGDATAGGKVQAPLPLLGLTFEYYPSQRWTVGAQGQFLVLDIEDDVLEYSGGFFDVSGRAHYWLYNQLGVGGGFDWFSINMDVNGEKWQGALDYEYFGPQLYVLTRF